MLIHRKPQYAAEAAIIERDWGIINPLAMDWMPEDMQLAADAVPTPITSPNSGIPVWYTMYEDPEVIRIFQTPNMAARIYAEKKMGAFVTDTAFFPVIENTGEVSSYDDFGTSGRSDANANFVQRQSYRFQTSTEYGELQEERAGAAKLSWVSELNISAAKTLDKFMDFVYHFGVSGLQNYGLLNDPSLSAAIGPTTKVAGGVKWVLNGAINALPTEVYADFTSLYNTLVTQAPGLIDQDTSYTFVYPNTVATGMTATNSFGITVREIIKESFPNVKFVVDPRFATAAGNVVQLIANEIDGKPTGWCAFNEKQRSHRLIPSDSSFRQKKSAASWGAVIRYPLGVAQMIGV